MDLIATTIFHFHSSRLFEEDPEANCISGKCSLKTRAGELVTSSARLVYLWLVKHLGYLDEIYELVWREQKKQADSFGFCWNGLAKASAVSRWSSSRVDCTYWHWDTFGHLASLKLTGWAKKWPSWERERERKRIVGDRKIWRSRVSLSCWSPNDAQCFWHAATKSNRLLRELAEERPIRVS